MQRYCGGRRKREWNGGRALFLLPLMNQQQALPFFHEQMEEWRTRRGGSSKWKTVKELFTLKALACCGSQWGSSRGRSNHTEDEYTSNQDNYIDDDYDNSYHYSHESQQQLVQFRHQHCLPHHRLQTNATDQEMNLAAALQAERQFRAAAETGPVKMPLVRLLEAREGEERERISQSEEGEGMGVCCCVCMGSKKGAAFIPCGHTFCRVCARELWLNRGACPLCNRSILEILDIF